MARIVFMGTPEFAVPLLVACTEVGEVVAVITQPDRPKGRGRELAAPPVKEWALARGLDVWQPEKVKTPGFEARLRAVNADVAVVAAYGRILPKGVLEAPRHGCVNVHASLLPKLRGAAPIQWAIARGETETGVTLMQMDEGLDTGPMLAARRVPIEPADTGGSLHEKLSALGRALLEEELPRFLRGELVPRPQDPSLHTLAPIIHKDDGRLDFTRPAAELERQVRAFDPWPGTFTRWNGQHLKILRAHVEPGSGRPGEVVRAGAAGLVVACGEGALAIDELQLEGRRRMKAGELVVGQRVKPGDALG